jgi:hypothetical protein
MPRRPRPNSVDQKRHRKKAWLGLANPKGWRRHGPGLLARLRGAGPRKGPAP